MSTVAPLLDCTGLTLAIGREARVLVRDAAFAVNPGELWCLIGPNGIGKTTLLHALAGLRAVQAGEVRLAGRPLAEWPLADAALRRGFLPQVVHDAFSASVLEVVMMGRHPHSTRWQWEGEGDRETALAALAAVDLAGFEQRDVLTLSGGERQRVALAALLAQQAPLYLLDEPLTHLDLHHQVQVLRHLRELAATRNTGILMSVHDLNLAARFASHALIFMPGGRVTQGPVAAVMSEPVLSEAFSHRIVSVAAAGHTLFVAD
jgi:iron complex transport system ATP-binding protein